MDRVHGAVRRWTTARIRGSGRQVTPRFVRFIGFIRFVRFGRFVRLRALLPLVLLAAWTSGHATRAQVTTRAVFVSARDQAGQFVSTLTPADVSVKEDGKVRAVTAVEPAVGATKMVV